MILAAFLFAPRDSRRAGGSSTGGWFGRARQVAEPESPSALSAADRALVARIQRGESDAFAALMNAYYPQLFSFVSRYVDSADAADDVLQDLFLRIWDRRASWELRGSLRAYLFMAARNAASHSRARRSARARAEQAASELAATEVDPFNIADAVERHDLAAIVRTVVADLPDRCREIFRLSREDGLSYREIAEVLGISVSTVKTQMGRAVVALDRKLGTLF